MLLVLAVPRAVFAALRDDRREGAEERQEPVMAIALLAGAALALASTQAGRLLDNPEFDTLLILVWVFIAGGLVGIINLWLGGWILYLGLRGLDGAGSFRRARHLLAYAAAPLILSLILWPVRLALYGDDVFRSGGSDGGEGAAVFDVLDAALLAWSVGLLLIGVREVHGWRWGRSLAAVALSGALGGVLVLLLTRTNPIDWLGS